MIELNSDSDEDGGDGEGIAAARVLRLVLSTQAASRKLFAASSSPPHHRRSVEDDGSVGEWVRLWAEQGRQHSRVYQLCILDASDLENVMRGLCGEMAPAEVDALAGVSASRALARAASTVAERLLARAPAPSPPPRGRRAAARHVLVLTGLNGMKRRLFQGETSDAEKRFAACAWELGQAAILAILAEHAAWHVFVATKDKADGYVEALVRAVDRCALLDQE